MHQYIWQQLKQFTLETHTAIIERQDRTISKKRLITQEHNLIGYVGLVEYFH